MAGGGDEAPVRLLVWTKDPDLRKKLVDHLGGSGIAVTEAGGGREAMGILMDSPVDVILAETDSPGGEGVNLLRAFRRARPEAALIVISRVLDVSRSMEGMKLGVFDEFLLPFDMEALAGRIREAARREPSAPEPGPSATPRASSGTSRASVTRPQAPMATPREALVTPRAPLANHQANLRRL